MASPQDMADASITPEMKKLYLQVDGSHTPMDILGFSTSTGWTLKDLKDIYHSLALRLHPDKCPPSQVDLHTRLFAKVQNAYEEVCKSDENASERPDHVCRTKQMQRPAPDVFEAELIKEVRNGPHEPSPMVQFRKPRYAMSHQDRKAIKHVKQNLGAEIHYQEAWQRERDKRGKQAMKQDQKDTGRELRYPKKTAK